VADIISRLVNSNAGATIRQTTSFTNEYEYSFEDSDREEALPTAAQTPPE